MHTEEKFLQYFKHGVSVEDIVDIRLIGFS